MATGSLFMLPLPRSSARRARGGWRSAAVAGWPGPVTLWTQADGAGYRAALRLRLALGGRAAACELAPDGMDWADVAQVERDEREAIATGD